MSEMIERVARALYERENALGMQFPGASDHFAWDGPNFKGQKVWREMARVAIEAMREPTEEMKNCSDEVHWGYSCNTCGGLEAGWHAMITAALTSPGTA